jgi:hypothetical protein
LGWPSSAASRSYSTLTRKTTSSTPT